MPLSVASFENAFSHLIGCCFFFVCLFVFYGFSAPERSPGEANGNPWIRISWTEAAVHGVIKNQTRLSN